jgi:hypothetical protein
VSGFFLLKAGTIHAFEPAPSDSDLEVIDLTLIANCDSYVTVEISSSYQHSQVSLGLVCSVFLICLLI